jgi:hypothetical protein
MDCYRAALKDMLKAANIDKVLVEMRAQAAAFLAAWKQRRGHSEGAVPEGRLPFYQSSPRAGLRYLLFATRNPV